MSNKLDPFENPNEIAFFISAMTAEWMTAESAINPDGSTTWTFTVNLPNPDPRQSKPPEQEKRPL